MKTTKILITAPNLITGGAEKQLIYLIDGLVKLGFEVVLFLLELEGEYLAKVPKAVKILTPTSPKPRKPFKGLWKVKEIIKVTHKEDPDILYSRLWPTKVATAFAGFLLRKKVVFSEDRALSRLIDEGGRGKANLKLHVRKTASQLAKVVVPVSQGIADELEQIFKLCPEKVKLIYNGFDLEEMRKKAAEEVSHPWFNNRKEPVVGALGRMVELKGFKYLFEAIKIVNDEGIPVRLLMIGKGELLEELRTQAERLGIKDRVEFLGFVENPFAYLARCDLFVLSSLYEGLPSTLIEAMALGLPVISTRCPTGPEEIIEDGKNGLLVPVADSKAIAEAIVRVLRDKDLNMRLRVEGKRRAEDFSLENMVSRFADIFVNLSAQ
ncbi:MAG TPA: glycosyltransferase [Thermodesulfobacteriota bacterium]|nr:glycosyltransferase [Thermodesulfobacteriota bacterium]